MIRGYARVSTGRQSVAAQLTQLKAAGCGKVFQEAASGGPDWPHPAPQGDDRLEAGDTLMVTRLDRFAR